MAKSRGLFPGPRSVPKRSFSSAAGNSEYKHVLPNTDDYQIGMTGWKAGRSAGGISGENRLAGRPIFNSADIQGDGGLAWDASAAQAMQTKGKPDSGYQKTDKPIPVKIQR